MKDQIHVRIAADSQNPLGVRLTSFILTYPRYIHAEFMTHRVVSKSSASSRAVPTAKLLTMAEENPVIPVQWGSHKPGMQSGELLDQASQKEAEFKWRALADVAAAGARQLNQLGLAKQWANRPLEPYLPITVLATATEWKNFFSLRAHPAAMPDLQVLAYRMLAKYLEREPRQLGWGDWHMPFGDKMEPGWSDEEKLRVATARCARLSYQTFDGDYSYDEDRRLHDQLRDSGHWSCFEHCAQAKHHFDNHAERSNFHPTWMQYRKTFGNEHGRDADLGLILQNKPDWITV